MKIHRPFPRAALSLLLTLLLGALMPPSSSFGQGSMTPPPGSPAPTMKTLQQVEPRIDLQATTVPAGVDTTNGGYHFIINAPGSYYLSANLGVTKGNGIQITAEGVTLDLNGFEISRSSGSGAGIEILETAHRAVIRNGSIKGFLYGINSLTSGPVYARSCAFRDLSVSGCTQTGINAGKGAVLESCRAHDNSGNSGIRAEEGSTLTNCTAHNNNTAFGILAQSGSTLSNCSAYGNTTGTGISAGSGSTLSNCSAFENTVTNGIFASAGSTLRNCSAFANQSAAAISAGISTGAGCTLINCASKDNVSSASSSPTTGMGFSVGESSTIQNCAASGNEGDGIVLSNDSVARENNCDGNGVSGSGAGIHATGNDNRIEANNVVDNDRGIDVDSTGSLIIKNSASGNATNYEIAAGNFFGAIVNVVAPAGSPTPAPVNGSAAPSSIGTTDPWANISY